MKLLELATHHTQTVFFNMGNSLYNSYMESTPRYGMPEKIPGEISSKYWLLLARQNQPSKQHYPTDSEIIEALPGADIGHLRAY